MKEKFYEWFLLLSKFLNFLSFYDEISLVFLTLFLWLTLLQRSPFSPPLPTSTQPPAPHPSGHHHTVVCVYVSCTYTLWLILSPSFIQSPSPLTAISLANVSMPLFLLFIRFHIKWDVWYLSFSDWRERQISLSITISRFTQSVRKSKISYLFAAT